MRSLAVTVLAAIIAVIGLTTEVYAESQSTNDGRNPYYSGNNYNGYYGGGYYRYRRHWRGYRSYYGPRYVVRRGYYRGDGCTRRRFDAYGNVYYKVRRACR
jgi:hypothetical protein